MKVLNTKSNFLGLPSENSSYEKSRIIILSAPYEKTVSYGGGTGKAPNAIIDASHYVEFFDDEFQRELCFKEGIATLPAVQFGDRTGKKMLSMLEKAVGEHITNGKF